MLWNRLGSDTIKDTFGQWDDYVAQKSGSTIQLPALYVDEEEARNTLDYLNVITVARFTDDESTTGLGQQLLLSLAAVTRPLSFEVVGLGPQPIYHGKEIDDALTARRNSQAPDEWSEPSVTVQFVTHERDAAAVEQQLLSCYPNSAVVDEGYLPWPNALPGSDVVWNHGLRWQFVF